MPRLGGLAIAEDSAVKTLQEYENSRRTPRRKQPMKTAKRNILINDTKYQQPPTSKI